MDVAGVSPKEIARIINAHLCTLPVHELDSPDVLECAIVIGALHPSDWAIRFKLYHLVLVELVADSANGSR